MRDHWFFYNCTPLNHLPQAAWIDDKTVCKRFFQRQNFPHAEGRAFRNARLGYRYGLKLGFPLVVKPQNGSLSAHVTYPIHSADELREAIEIAKLFQPGFVVERFIPGDLYRISILGKRHVFVCRKEPAFVEGDGERTIEALIKTKNQHPDRRDQTNTTLHPIPLSERTVEILANQGYSLTSILPSGKRVNCSVKATLAAGCEIIDYTPDLHPMTRELFLRLAQSFENEIIGIDYITPDIKAPYTAQQTAILELNSRPYVDMHQFPSQGKAHPIAELAWELVDEILSRD